MAGADSEPKSHRLPHILCHMAVMERRDFSPVSAGLSHYREGIQQFEMSEKIRVRESRSHMEKVQQLVW